MIIKKYTSNTEHGAILMAKEDLGSDAIVMNIKKTKPKGIFRFFSKTKVEVTAAIDEDKSYENVPRETLSYKKPEKNLDITDSLDDDKNQNETTAIEKKLDSLQSLIEQKISAKQDEKNGKSEDETTSYESSAKEDKNIDKLEACKQLIYEQLVQNEMDEAYAKQLIDEIQGSISLESNIDVILGSIYQKIILKLGQIQLINTNEQDKNFYFFVGPTGVGKTTTIAKIASNLKLNRNLKIMLVTADTYRIAAVEQLKTYANILGIPLKVVYSASDLEGMLEELMEYDVVLIDTAGHSPSNDEHAKELKELLECVDADKREAYLVLSTTTKYRDLKEITKAYDKITKYNLIFTKLDETTCIGNIYNIRVFTNASLSYTTYGQNVPDDIGKIDPQSVAKKLLGGEA